MKYFSQPTLNKQSGTPVVARGCASCWSPWDVQRYRGGNLTGDQRGREEAVEVRQKEGKGVDRESRESIVHVVAVRHAVFRLGQRAFNIVF